MANLNQEMIYFDSYDLLIAPPFRSLSTLYSTDSSWDVNEDAYQPWSVEVGLLGNMALLNSSKRMGCIRCEWNLLSQL
jgi:hypothetical protein